MKQLANLYRWRYNGLVDHTPACQALVLPPELPVALQFVDTGKPTSSKRKDAKPERSEGETNTTVRGSWLRDHVAKQVVDSPHLGAVRIQEARYICWTVRYLALVGIAGKRITVLSPYKNQVDCIQRQLADGATDAIAGVTVYTVDQFQGTPIDSRATRQRHNPN